VLGNLTQNADRYARGTPLEVRLSVTEQDRVRISVRDHGPGVPSEIRRRLFRQYYRFDDGSGDSMAVMTDGSRGLGIGLYVSARLVKLHGGRMRVQDAEGGGAEFIIEMPVSAAAFSQPAASEKATADDTMVAGSQVNQRV
jgi:signal transduction histidine kinase